MKITKTRRAFWIMCTVSFVMGLLCALLWAQQPKEQFMICVEGSYGWFNIPHTDLNFKTGVCESVSEDFWRLLAKAGFLSAGSPLDHKIADFQFWLEHLPENQNLKFHLQSTGRIQSLVVTTKSATKE